MNPTRMDQKRWFVTDSILFVLGDLRNILILVDCIKDGGYRLERKLR